MEKSLTLFGYLFALLGASSVEAKDTFTVIEPSTTEDSSAVHHDDTEYLHFGNHHRRIYYYRGPINDFTSAD